MIAEPFSSLLADALVVFGVFIMTVGVYGMVRLPDTYTRLHATSKAVVLGVISLLAASVVTGDPEIIYRVVLIGVSLVLTTPVSAHVIARAAYWRGEEMESPGAVDESDKDLAGG
jgi:multicomponent Na+:H+ antiporter subunit G